MFTLLLFFDVDGCVVICVDTAIIRGVAVVVVVSIAVVVAIVVIVV